MEASGEGQRPRQGAQGRRSPSIEEALDPHHNGLNLLRLVMASGVIWFHAYPLTQTPIPDIRLHRWLEEGWVDGFFVLSGYLVVGSWLRRPRPGAYLRNRLLRLYPAFLVCLALTAFVFAPLASRVEGVPYAVTDGVKYATSNLGLLIRTPHIGETLSTVPYPGEWNGSLWTLFFEFLCYLAVLALGLLGVLRTRWGVPLLFAVAWAFDLIIALRPEWAEIKIPVGSLAIGFVTAKSAARFACVFAAGALIYHLRRRLPCSWRWVALAAGIVIASLWLPHHRPTAALALAYGLVAAGALIRRDAFVLREDISYGTYIYGYPVQQLLVAAFPRIGFGPYVLASLLFAWVLGAASWRWVEKPMLALKGGRAAWRLP